MDFVRSWVRPMISGQTRRAALPVAMVVGTLLVVLNQGSTVLAGHVDATVLGRAFLNYLVPYVVSSVGYLRALNALADQRGDRIDPGPA